MSGQLPGGIPPMMGIPTNLPGGTIPQNQNKPGTQ